MEKLVPIKQVHLNHNAFKQIDVSWYTRLKRLPAKTQKNNCQVLCKISFVVVRVVTDRRQNYVCAEFAKEIFYQPTIFFVVTFKTWHFYKVSKNLIQSSSSFIFKNIWIRNSKEKAAKMPPKKGYEVTSEGKNSCD